MLLAWERFRDLLAEEFELESSDIVKETAFVPDLGFDSIEFLRLSCFITTLYGGDIIDDQLDLRLLTAGALYDRYVVEAASPPRPSS
jgi:acyl carrier protein